jgi:hypothetical protein
MALSLYSFCEIMNYNRVAAYQFAFFSSSGKMNIADKNLYSIQKMRSF